MIVLQASLAISVRQLLISAFLTRAMVVIVLKSHLIALHVIAFLGILVNNVRMILMSVNCTNRVKTEDFAIMRNQASLVSVLLDM